MKQLNCDCGATIRGKSDDEVMKLAREHSKSVHQHEVTPVEEQQIRGQIKNA
jgi:predicted small metal-binding protein